MPLHPLMRDFAINELKSNLSTRDILHSYSARVEESFGGEVVFEDKRVLLEASDVCNLRRGVNRSQFGIDTTRTVEHELLRLFGPTSEPSTVKNAAFWFKPKGSGEEDRFELGLATAEQRALAWNHANGNVIMVDGTFGISKHKLLLFIVLTLNENKHVIPLAYFVFSPPTGNKQTSSGYDGAVLTRLFAKYRAGLEKDADLKFEPK
ncbi:hypothetical protein HK104_006918, partial [Borealophlyctis nickersoniae]